MPASLAHITPSTPMGATLVADGATFRVWAPHAHTVHVVGSFNGFTRREDARLVESKGYWHGFISGVGEGDSYKFRIDGDAGTGLKRDPYARELAVPGWECIVRSPAFPWHDASFAAPPFHRLVIYQLHVGAFYSASPGQPGRFLDVVDRLPYLADLGINAIQLLPIQEFPGDFSLGYNGTDYFSPEMAYEVDAAALAPYLARANALLADKGLAPYQPRDVQGEANQLKVLVDLCHVHGIAVIFDLVFNHAGGGFDDESIWFFDRQRGVEQPLWWNSLYFSDQTWAGGVVFNFGSDPVRAFLIDNVGFLVREYHANGFRFDEVSVIDRHGYGHGWSFCQDLTATVRHDHPSALLHAEYWNVNPWVVTSLDRGGAGFDSTMTDGPRIAIRALLAAASVPGGGPLPVGAVADSLGLNYLRDRWRGVNSLENHDLVMQPKSASEDNRMDRIARAADPSNPRSWYARSRARAVTGLLLTMPGIPMLFMGEEFLEDKRWTDDVEGHPELQLYWDGLNAPDSVMRDFLRFTREAIALRQQYPALSSEGYALIHAHDDHRVLAFQRWLPGIGEDVVVAINFAEETKFGYALGFPGSGRWREVFNSDVYDGWVNPRTQGNGGSIEASGAPLHGLPASAALTMPANSILVFAR